MEAYKEYLSWLDLDWLEKELTSLKRIEGYSILWAKKEVRTKIDLILGMIN